MSEIVYDDETKEYVRSRDKELRDLKNKIIDELLDQLVNNYYIEFTFQIGTQTVKVTARLKKVSQ